MGGEQGGGGFDPYTFTWIYLPETTHCVIFYLIFTFALSFHVVCDTLGCTENEVCRFRDAYGCGCLEGQRPYPETFGRCTALQIT